MRKPLHTLRELEQMLQPRCEYSASETLRSSMTAASFSQNRTVSGVGRSHRLPFRVALGAVAAVAVAVIFFMMKPADVVAKPMGVDIIMNAVDSMQKAVCFDMFFEARTAEGENFAFFDPACDFITHRMQTMPSAGIWKMEKKGRAALCDGSHTWVWHPDSRVGFKADRVNVLEDFDMLRNPCDVLRNEQLLVKGNKAVESSIAETDSTITLTVKVPADKRFANDFVRFSTLAAYETHRIYKFDKRTSRLLSMRIDAKVGNKTVTMLRSKSVSYGYASLDATRELPSSIKWHDRTAEADQVLNRSLPDETVAPRTAEQAVEMAFVALARWDTEVLKSFFRDYDLDEIRENYAGTTLVSQSPAPGYPDYPGKRIECHIRLANGVAKSLTIAVRNDNPAHIWVADGGF